MHHKRLIISWTIVCLVVSLAVCYLGSAYPFVKHLKANQ